jgi:hypothetical protein
VVLVLAAVEVALAVQAVGHRRRAPGSPHSPPASSSAVGSPLAALAVEMVASSSPVLAAVLLAAVLAVVLATVEAVASSPPSCSRPSRRRWASR